MDRISEMTPYYVIARVRARERSWRLPRLRHRRAREAAAVLDAEIAARQATQRFLGTDRAVGSVWNGCPDGTASGVVAGLPFRWAPDAGGTGELALARSCWGCGTGSWWAPVRSEGQLIGALAEDRCRCRHAGGGERPAAAGF